MINQYRREIIVPQGTSMVEVTSFIRTHFGIALSELPDEIRPVDQEIILANSFVKTGLALIFHGAANPEWQTAVEVTDGWQVGVPTSFDAAHIISAGQKKTLVIQ